MDAGAEHRRIVGLGQRLVQQPRRGLEVILAVHPQVGKRPPRASVPAARWRQDHSKRLPRRGSLPRWPAACPADRRRRCASSAWSRRGYRGRELQQFRSGGGCTAQLGHPGRVFQPGRDRGRRAAGGERLVTCLLLGVHRAAGGQRVQLAAPGRRDSRQHRRRQQRVGEAQPSGVHLQHACHDRRVQVVCPARPPRDSGSTARQALPRPPPAHRPPTRAARAAARRPGR